MFTTHARTLQSVKFAVSSLTLLLFSLPQSSYADCVTCPGLLGPSVVRISTWHQGEGHAKEEDLTRADHFAAAAD